ncbi:MAG: endonuclease/exonuclease/phosphatase family protein [Gallionellaceae bacterium]|nr:endonuclease/exonuclease/phosphatase family protein [Gallionellaceae bacterium]
MTTLTIATYNIHKGFSHFNQRVVLHELRERLRELNADIVFLQEVQGENSLDARRYRNYPKQPQYEFLAEQIWPHHVYGKNAVYDEGHHGNAVLSRYPILSWDNQDISAHRYEDRGLLHCEIAVPAIDGAELNPVLHCMCVHFGLSARGRSKQFNALVARVKEKVPDSAPLIIAGDFNDWSNQASRLLAHELQLHEAFEVSHGKLARSYPVSMPLLRMDRIYVRGLSVQHSEVHAHYPWNKISDHAALSTRLTLP